MNKYMKEAIKQAYIGINNHHGGPFGCVIVKDGKVIGEGHNMVLENNDPTCHGEVQAIRDACKNINSYSLEGCDVYTTGEPCQMCLCACLWANIHKIYYGCTIKDSGIIGFRDDKFDHIFQNREACAEILEELDRKECIELFKDYVKMEHTIY